jgi:restriction system protein
MNIEMQIEELIHHFNVPVTVLNEERSYWLVRTQSGDYHQEFYFDNYIAIGWNEFNDVENFNFKDGTKEKKRISELIDSQYEEVNQPGRIYNQIRRFWYEIEIGDIVMIPTQNSKHISFGVITSKPYIKSLSESSLDEDVCPFQKRRDVNWIKTIDREKLDPYLYKMMHSQNTINSANDYAPFIDRTLHSFYIKGDRAHLVINVKKEEKIPAQDLMLFVAGVIELVPLLNELDVINTKFDKSDLDMKLNVQSPGIIEFFSENAPWLILGIGILMTFMVGGGVKFSYTEGKTDFEAQSKGLYGMWSQFQKQKNQHELEKLKLEHQLSMDKLKAELPQELKNLLDKPNDREG